MKADRVSNLSGCAMTMSGQLVPEGHGVDIDVHRLGDVVEDAAGGDVVLVEPAG